MTTTSTTKQASFSNKIEQMRSNDAISEALETAKIKWSSGNYDINSILVHLASKKCKVTIKREYHFVEPTTTKIRETAMYVFGNNESLRVFIVKAILDFESLGTTGKCLWYSHTDNNKLWLVNFSQIPTGNWVFHRYLYPFNYFEIDV
jgi:hypothetical protein